MERESHLAAHEAMRAVRSLAWNRKVLPVIEGRIERAEQTVKSYLTLQDTTTARLGAFQVDLVGEEINITRLQTDGWEQLTFLDSEDQELPQSGDIFVADPLAIITQSSTDSAHGR